MTPTSLSPSEIRHIAMQAQKATLELEAAIAKGQKKKVQACLDQGAIPAWVTYANKKGTPMGSALFKALKHKDLDLLTLLIDAGAPGDSVKQKTLFQWAIKAQFPEAIKLLGEKLNLKPILDDFIEAIESDEVSAFKALDALSFLDRKSPLHRNLPFSCLYWVKSSNMAKYLVETGADVNHSVLIGANTSPWTPLDWIMNNAKSAKPNQSVNILGVVVTGLEEMGDEDPTSIVQFLVEQGAVISKTSMLLACRKAYPEMLSYLSEANPDWRWEENTEEKHFHLHQFKKEHPLLWQRLVSEQEARDLNQALPPSLISRAPKVL